MLSVKIPRSKALKTGKPDIFASEYMPEPLISLGYNFFYTKNREKLQVASSLPTSLKDIYLVVNDFTPTHPETNVLKEFEDHISRNHIKYPVNIIMLQVWEMLHECKLVSTKSTLVLGGDPYDAIVPIMSSSDKSTCHTVLKNKIVTVNKTKDIPTSKIVDQTDNTNVVLDEKLFETIKQKIDLIIGKETSRTSTEQDMYEILLRELLTAMKVLKPGGHFICLIKDMFTSMTIKILLLMRQVFKEMYVYKPHASSSHEADRYIICKGYEPNETLLTGISKVLEKVNKTLPKDQYLYDIFPEFEIDQVEEINDLRHANSMLIKREYQIVNKMYEFLQEKNYYGTKYHTYLTNQSESCKKWIQQYLSRK